MKLMHLFDFPQPKFHMFVFQVEASSNVKNEVIENADENVDTAKTVRRGLVNNTKICMIK